MDGGNWRGGLAIFYAAQSIAPGSEACCAFGVSRIQSGTMANWRFLFAIEGCCTVAFFFSFFFFFWRTGICRKVQAQTKFLTEEKEEYRLQDAG